MGKVKLGVQSKNSVNHFSHPHPLELTTHHTKQGLTPSSSSSSSLSCSACMLQPISGSPFYACKTCNFSLHADCFKMHREITHPCHKHHVFTLLPKTPYPFGFFTCDACGEESDGFSYHCNPCGLDLHVQCAVLPLSVTHHSHHHPLQIIFPSLHSQTQVFSCDICKTLGQGKFWKYRCHSCDFDAHLNCTKTKTLSQPNLGFRPQVPQQFNRPPPLQNLVAPNVNLQGNNNGVGNNGGRQNFEELMRACIENYSRLYREQQAAAVGGVGGGGLSQSGNYGGSFPAGGGGEGLDFLDALNGGGGVNGDGDEYLRLLNGGGSGGGGGGGGGGLDFLQALNGGGGGGVDPYLQLLNAGGGGGGVDQYLQLLNAGGGGGAGGQNYLQAFTGGGWGGGGGAAFLQALMGGGGGVSNLSNILGGDGGASMINTLAGLFGGLNF